MLFVLPLYLVIIHPVSVAQITPIGEAQGGKYINHISAKASDYPLGLYFFADIENDHWYYYDVLTGDPVDYDDPLYPNLIFRETFS